MRNGAIVMSKKNKDKLFRIKGFIKSKEERKIAILEELCQYSTKPQFEYIDELILYWSPKNLKDEINEEYNISTYDENILMENVNK
ncbi:MAG: hypothetical protein PWQ67_878 [Clostridia bacterium]|jgi:16S rRNA C1402 (ribose-2'-O) methylase RsmI|nr:hypothetical protein [Clostridia bacterium]MDN5322424.1 hypothetical protein [Clostridia bacterium]